MMKKYALAAALVATAALSGCGAAPEPVEVVATETATHTSTPSPSATASASATADAVAETTVEKAAAQFTPGDARLVTVDALGTVGMFMNPDTGHYYVCNGGELTAAQGAPVESGTCAGPFTDYYEAGQLTSRLSDVVGAAIANELEQEFGPIEPVEPVDEGDITAQFWDCMDAGGTEETCLQ